MSFPKVVIFFLITTIAHFSYGQAHIAEVDFGAIRKVGVRSFISDQIFDNHSLAEIRPSLQLDSDISEYYVQEKEFIVNSDLQSVWDHYIITQPGKGWSTQMITTELIYSKSSNTCFYLGEESESLQEGQVLFLNLNFLFGVYNLPIAFEIISVDIASHIMQFSYIEGNLSKGKQVISFVALDRNKTAIYHKSYYKSSSSIRDHFLYPFFHKVMINGFHRNMRKLMIKKS